MCHICVEAQWRKTFRTEEVMRILELCRSEGKMSFRQMFRQRDHGHPDGVKKEILAAEVGVKIYFQPSIVTAVYLSLISVLEENIDLEKAAIISSAFRIA